VVKCCNAEEFQLKQGDDDSVRRRTDASSGEDSERSSEQAAAGGRTSTTTTALTRTTTTTVSLPDDSASAPHAAVNCEPPIIVLQEAPVAPRQAGLLDAAAAAVWIERQRTLHDASRAAAAGARARVAADARARGRSAAPMSRRQRINRRRQQAAATSARSRPWNDPLTGVLLCPEALEHIVVHSTIVPDPSNSAGPSVASAQTSK